MPGFFAADRSTASLRRYLQSRDFNVHAWDEGRNPGINDALYRRLARRVKQLSREHGSTVSLVGWSLGGIYARLLAHRNPGAVRQVVTLGSPFKMRQYGSVNGAVTRLYQRFNPERQRDPMLEYADLWAAPPPVPSTSIYSKGDGVAHWSFCVDDVEDEHTENIALPGSHLGMTHNPLFMYCVADRLAQPEGAWQRFELLPQLQSLLQRAVG
ncbi:MAG: alpha/beta hydrolase [Halieaceae bacterium]|nr:alpha/beta hydrolase [Halieaceae bacterium]